MHAIADTEKLVADGVITPDQAREIEVRARDGMAALAVNTVLCFGILAATAGLIFYLADALTVALAGAAALVSGLFILARGSDLYRMFGNAAALVGSGLLIGGASLELIMSYEDIAGWVMIAGGALVAAIAGRALIKGGLTARFVAGSIFLMGVATHLTGFAALLMQYEVSGLPIVISYFYGFAVIAGAGWLTDIRLITALAIVPFAQMLDAGTFYFHALYAFYSYEPALSILQMAVLIGVGVWVTGRVATRHGRHAHILVVMAFVVANLCALVGSLWGDVVGETVWGPGRYKSWDMKWEDYVAARDAFYETTLTISEDVFSILWAVALAAILFWAARKPHRALFNAALTFGAIHAYTQLFESLDADPLAFVILGLTAIPLAWGMWRMNERLKG